MAEHFFSLAAADQRDALLQAASDLGRPAYLLEKSTIEQPCRETCVWFPKVTHGSSWKTTTGECLKAACSTVNQWPSMR